MRFCWLLLALVFGQDVFATPNAEQVRLEQAIGDGPDISMYLDARRDDGNPVPVADLGRIEVHVDGQPALIESAVDFADSGEGVAYIFLVLERGARTRLSRVHGLLFPRGIRPNRLVAGP